MRGQAASRAVALRGPLKKRPLRVTEMDCWRAATGVNPPHRFPFEIATLLLIRRTSPEVRHALCPLRQRSRLCRARAMVTLFERLEHLCEGAIAIDRGGRVIYVTREISGVARPEADGGSDRTADRGDHPNSLMRNVAESGEPILLDIMELGGEQLVVTRMPIEDEERNVIGAISASCSTTTSRA